MFCKNCGKELDGTSKFCQECGAKVILEGEEKKPNSFENNSSVVTSENKNALKKGKKKKGKTVGILLIVFAIICMFFSCIGGGDTDEQTDSKQEVTNVEEEKGNVEENSDEIQETVNEQEVYMESENEVDEISANDLDGFESVDELIQTCTVMTESVYKDVLRNPADYEGVYFAADVKISSVREEQNQKVYLMYLINKDQAIEFSKFSTYQTFPDIVLPDINTPIWVREIRNEDSDLYVNLIEEDVVRIYGRFDGLEIVQNATNNSHSEEMGLKLIYAELAQSLDDILRPLYYVDAEEDNSEDYEINGDGYSDEELTAMFVEYCRRHYGEDVPIIDIEGKDGNIVSFHLYEDLGDHTSTWGYYDIDRTTGKGYDSVMGDEINLNE